LNGIEWYTNNTCFDLGPLTLNKSIYFKDSVEKNDFKEETKVEEVNEVQKIQKDEEVSFCNDEENQILDEESHEEV